MGRADNIEAEFPPGIKLPAELRRLCDFLDRTDYPISGYMRLEPEGEGLKAWFGDAGHATLGSSDDWGKPQKFFPEAIRLAAERFGVAMESK